MLTTTNEEQGGQYYFNIGDWFWLKTPGRNRKQTDPYVTATDSRRFGWQLGCITHIGSNFVVVRCPDFKAGRDDRYHDCWRNHEIHMDDVMDLLEPAPDSRAIIQDTIRHHQGRADKLFKHIQRLMSAVGVPKENLLQTTFSSGDGLNELALASQVTDVQALKRSLVSAQRYHIPNLQARMKTSYNLLSIWMEAEAIPLNARMSALDNNIGKIDSRVFNISLYAGLLERSECIRQGNPGHAYDQIHVMQRMVYMDEECLANVDDNGMDIRDIESFDKWLAKPENFERVLPFRKTIVAIRVRRNPKKRHDDSPLDAYVNIILAASDKQTFLYARNGAQLHRLTIDDFQFGGKLFLGSDTPISEPQMFKIDSFGAEFMTVREYEDRTAERDQWLKDNPYSEWKKTAHASFNHESDWHSAWHRSHRFNPSEWSNLDRSSLQYDKAMEHLRAQMEATNRISLIIQGLLDRSEVFQPHPPVQTWVPDSFNQHIKLVYDHDLNIHFGAAPDIDAYISTCNESANRDSLFYGQEEEWERREAEKYNDSHRHLDVDFKTLHRPKGNLGPGKITKAAKWSESRRSARFEWKRDPLKGNGGPVTDSITLPVSALFNVSAYELGDYKQFFRDSRTRQQYLAWAPMLLAAEMYTREKKNHE